MANPGTEQTNPQSRPKGTSHRGFASMDPAVQREIARKGGEAVSRDRQHMAEIGRKGGEAGGRRHREKTESSSALSSEQSFEKPVQ